MCSVVVVKDGDDLVELAKYLVMTSHVCSQDATYDPFADHFVDVGSKGAENVCCRVLQDVESNRTVMILKRRDVIVTQRQLGSCIDLSMCNKQEAKEQKNQ